MGEKGERIKIYKLIVIKTVTGCKHSTGSIVSNIALTVCDVGCVLNVLGGNFLSNRDV